MSKSIMKMNVMTRKYYVKHWVILDEYYKILTEIYEKLKKDPENEELINQKLSILRKIKHFLRYRSKYYDYYIYKK